MNEVSQVTNTTITHTTTGYWKCPACGNMNSPALRKCAFNCTMNEEVVQRPNMLTEG